MIRNIQTVALLIGCLSDWLHIHFGEFLLLLFLMLLLGAVALAVAVGFAFAAAVQGFIGFHPTL